jgi:hypothetical protein
MYAWHQLAFAIGGGIVDSRSLTARRVIDQQPTKPYLTHHRTAEAINKQMVDVEATSRVQHRDSGFTFRSDFLLLLVM